MAGNPHDRSAIPRTVLEHLLWRENHTYEEVAARFDQRAAELGEHASITARHLRRLASGERTGANPVTRRVLQAMFGQPAERLLSPWSEAESNPGTVPVTIHGADKALGWQDRQALTEATRRAHHVGMQLSTTNVNGETMDQLYDDVSSLAASYQRQPPSLVIGGLIETQNQIFDLLEGRQSPAHTRTLLLLAGITSGLLGKISHDLADPHTAMTHTRTAYLCADNADHNGLRAWVRGLQSLIAYWAGRYNESVRFAKHGAEAANDNSSSVWLPLNEARAWAALGNVQATRNAIQRAEEARESVLPDEVDELGGICMFSHNRQLYYTADALIWLPSEAMDAERYSEAAVSAYVDTNAPDWAFGDAAGSATDLAVARIQRGECEGAVEALNPVLSLPPGQRINGIVASVDRVYSALRKTIESVTTRDLQERIETFKACPLRALGTGA